MASSFVESMDLSDRAQKRNRNFGSIQDTGAEAAMSNEELSLIREAVQADASERKKRLAGGKKTPKACPAPSSEATPSTSPSDASSSASVDLPPKCDSTSSKPDDTPPGECDVPSGDAPPGEGGVPSDEDPYHKPGDRKRHNHPKQVPWVWIVVVIIITAALLYSWYDHTKGNGTRKDVRAFVAAIIIVIAAVVLYMLIR